jgi:CTD kinase subunit gamma
MDAFEARMQFIKMLQRLNASAKWNEQTVQFMLKNPDLMEDLYSCVLQELGTSSLNVRLNIFFFLECLCESSSAHAAVCRNWISRDIDEILDKVVPRTQLGLVNVSAADQIIESLSGRVIKPSKAMELQKRLLVRSREELSNGGGGDSSSRDATPQPMSKGDILRRMDEDRERSKRLKENIWAIDYSEGRKVEFDQSWDHLGGLTAYDREQMVEDNEICESMLIQ